MDEQRSEASEPARYTRRRDDLMNSRAMLDMVRFLMSRPSCDQISQHLVLNLFNAHRPRAAVIALFGADGSLHAVGAFGMTAAALEAYKALSLWDSSPMSDAVRSGEPVILDSAEEAQEQYPWLGTKDSPYDPMAVWPLSLPSQRVGAVQLTFTDSPDRDQLRADVTGVAAVLALYLSLLSTVTPATERIGHLLEREDRGGPGFPAASLSLVDGPQLDEPGPAPARRPAPGSLTDRQLRILGLMAKGLTNSQISKRVGFSESTVRQETMAIYRYFGVGGRREAVRLAGMRGMLDANAG
ncbi:MAG: helix-turn-helix transcriptional regulator [Candidatus Nanopelagicales bacterium]